MNLTELTKEIINGRRLTRDDDLSFMHDHQRPCRKMLGKL